MLNQAQQFAEQASRSRTLHILDYNLTGPHGEGCSIMVAQDSKHMRSSKLYPQCTEEYLD